MSAITEAMAQTFEHMAQEIADLRAERDRLRAELCEQTQPTSPIRLLNDLRAGLDKTRGRLQETERWA